MWLALVGGVLITAVLFVRAQSASTGLPERCVFLVGLAPALIVLWIRQAVPETEDWHAAKQAAGKAEPRLIDLFRGATLRTTPPMPKLLRLARNSGSWRTRTTTM